MKCKILLSALLAVGISGCQTMHFDRGENVTSTSSNSSWHHNFIFGYEATAPVMLSQRCADGTWTSVTTETSFLNALASNVVSNTVAPIWYPETVEVQCN